VCPKCVPPNTVILGDSKPIDKFKVGDHTICGGAVNAVHIRDYEGELALVKAVGLLPLKLTPDHPVLVSRIKGPKHGKRIFEEPNFIPAKDIRPWDSKKYGRDYGHCLVIPKLKREVKITRLDLEPFTSVVGAKTTKGMGYPMELEMNEELAWLMGLYIADGYAAEKEIGFCLSLSHKDEEVVEKVKKISLKVGYSPRIVNEPNERAVRVTIPSRILPRAFKSWFGSRADEKKIPDFLLMNSNDEIVRACLDGYLCGDGCTVNSNLMRSSTVSEILALQLQLLSFSIGMSCQLCVRKGGESYIRGRKIVGKPIYQVDFQIPRYWNSMFEFGNECVIAPVRKVGKVFYSGKVYNMSTERNIYLVSNAIVHNCGFRFSKSYARVTACRGCPVSVSTCPSIKCPRCSHEFPLA